MRILVVDDHALFRHGLSLTLSELFDAPQIIEAGSAVKAIELVSGDAQFDLVLIDLVMPGMNGQQCLKLLKQHLDEVPLVVVSSSEDPQDVREAFSNGARGYVLKSAAAQVLEHALPLVLSGEVYVPALALTAEPLVAAPGPATESNGTPNIRSMTPRQIEVLTLLAKGLSNKEIARDLGMVDSTVKVHVKAILQKLTVKNRTQAVIVGMKQGYISSD